jgi:hypothetical protein
MQLEFAGELVYWRGPAPWYFVVVPEDEARLLHAVAAEITYGWGVLPATIRIGATEWATSLFPKDGGYLVPVKAGVRDAEGLDEGDQVAVTVAVGP